METLKTIFAIIGAFCTVSFLLICFGIWISSRNKNRNHTMKVRGLK